ncbi:MAG: type II toxin-antitoxin system RelE/ParE family toxin [Plesiomonas sp.]
MSVFHIKLNEEDSVFEDFTKKASDKLIKNIYKKLQVYTEHSGVYSCSSLKILNPKIWGYKGTIYKLRVDCGKESARVLFVRTADNNVILLNAFIKKTQKTPKKEAFIAIKNFELLKENVTLTKLA